MFFLGIHTGGLDPLGGAFFNQRMRRHYFVRLLGRLLSPEFGALILLTAFFLVAPEIAHGANTQHTTSRGAFSFNAPEAAGTLAIATVIGIEGNMVIVSGGDTYLEGREFVKVLNGQGAGQSFQIIDAIGEVVVLSADVSQLLKTGDQLVIRQLPTMELLAG